MRFLLFAALVFAGCLDKDDDTGDGAGEDGGATDGGAACGSTQGFVYGTVTGPFSTDPNPAAEVFAWSEALGEVAGEMAGDGTYELNVEGDITWTIYGRVDECWSDDLPLDVEACEEYPLDIEIVDCDTADKPNLYLYPGRPTATEVVIEHGPRQQIVASAPTYRGAWRGISRPDGTFSTRGEDWPFLFYEISLQPAMGRAMQRDEGWCVPEAGAVDAMADLLGDFGFDALERDDFVEAWVHDLPPSPDGYAVYPQLDVDFAAEVVIEPALPLERLWLVVEDGAGCAVEPPAVVPFDRAGPHAVEWGVVLHDLAR